MVDVIIPVTGVVNKQLLEESVCHLALQLCHLLGQLSLEGLRKAGEQTGRLLLLNVLFVFHLQGRHVCLFVDRSSAGLSERNCLEGVQFFFFF